MTGLLFPLGAIIFLLFLVRRFVKPRDSLQAYQEKRLLHNNEKLNALHEEGKSLPPDEAMQPVVAAVQEIVELNGIEGVDLEPTGNALRVVTPFHQLHIVWALRVAQLRASSGPHDETIFRKGTWELQVDGKEPERFEELLDLMTEIQHYLFSKERTL